MLIYYYFYRIFHVKSVLIITVLVLLNLGYYIFLTHPRGNLINLLSQSDVYGKLYLVESLFFLRISMLLIMVFFTEALFENPKHDIVCLMRFKPYVIYGVKIVLLLVIHTGIFLFLFISVHFIYTQAVFFQAHFVHIESFFYSFLMSIRALAWMIFFIVVFRHKGWLLLVILGYLIVEINVSHNDLFHDYNLGAKTLFLLLSYVAQTPKQALAYLNHPALNLLLSFLLLGFTYAYARLKSLL